MSKHGSSPRAWCHQPLCGSSQDPVGQEMPQASADTSQPRAFLLLRPHAPSTPTWTLAHAQRVPTPVGSPKAPPPSPMQTNRQPPAASPCTAAGRKSPHHADNSSGHPQITGPPRTHRAAGQIRAWPVHVPASMQRRAEAACSLLCSPAPGLPLPCAPGAATNLRRSRRSRWSRFPRGCWSCRHRALSPRAPRP